MVDKSGQETLVISNTDLKSVEILFSLPKLVQNCLVCYVFLLVSICMVINLKFVLLMMVCMHVNRHHKKYTHTYILEKFINIYV